MAVLHALLRHNPTARAKPELEPVIAAHDGALQGKKILPLAFHLLGRRASSSALGGYVAQIAGAAPRRAAPGRAQERRAASATPRACAQRLGDDAFFAGLNKAGGTAAPADPCGAAS